MITEFRQFSKPKKVLWYMASPVETPGKGSYFNYTSVEKKIVMKETAICECIFKKGHLSSVSDL